MNYIECYNKINKSDSIKNILIKLLHNAVKNIHGICELSSRDSTKGMKNKSFQLEKHYMIPIMFQQVSTEKNLKVSQPI